MDKPRGFNDFVARVAAEVERLGKDVEHALREASESPTGRQVRQKISEVAPQVRRAVDEVRPQVRRAVDELGPGVRRVYDQVAPEVRKVVGEIGPNLTHAWRDLFGQASPPTARSRSDVPPNVSPEAYTPPDRPRPTPVTEVVEAEPPEMDAEMADEEEHEPPPPPKATRARSAKAKSTGAAKKPTARKPAPKKPKH